jgi:hypothetical protein
MVETWRDCEGSVDAVQMMQTRASPLAKSARRVDKEAKLKGSSSSQVNCKAD